MLVSDEREKPQSVGRQKKKTSLQGYRAWFPGVLVCPLLPKTSDLTPVLWDHSWPFAAARGAFTCIWPIPCKCTGPEKPRETISKIARRKWFWNYNGVVLFKFRCKKNIEYWGKLEDFKNRLCLHKTPDIRQMRRLLKSDILQRHFAHAWWSFPMIFFTSCVCLFV